MRMVHRVISLIACVVLFYLGVTGSWIQILDIRETLSGAAEATPVMQSINEGRYGNMDFAVMTQRDYAAAPLPADLDFHAAFSRVLGALHRSHPGELPTFVELRMADGRPIGQARFGQEPRDPRKFAQGVQAVDVESLKSVPTADIMPVFPPPSLRQSLKEWHRFWSRHDVPGVWFELLAGVAMWVLIITGLTMYFRLLKQRRKINRPGLFWMTSDRWRSLHRAVSLASAVLLVWVAFTGTWLGFESVWHSLQPRSGNHEIQGLSDGQVLQMVDETLAGLRKADVQAPIRVLRVRDYWGMKQGVVITAEPVTRQVIINTANGSPAGLTEPNYPKSGFPFGIVTHELIKHLHSGFLFGLWARIFDLLAGLALIFLSSSGLVMYLQMYGIRLKSGRRALFWK
ncbi:putative iron-regulated membrane protein [Novosphingobium sp. PhB165]|uniref:PepSY-associated TM helix domain-containing protein n=1 Tax=Novosphingobium sp. PhB165 TaxID=2485105 RepID=UPI0010E2C8CB|nr:PepSY-associated TM helix domain-containing protein [Novosphingobium sp. PhB165]TCM16613.1 putative iron-regulated membrane protein [Novosphingobium sp. PhB165]